MVLFKSKNSDVLKPLINLPEIMALSETIQNCSDLRTLTHVYNQKGDYDNPQISFDFGASFIIKGDMINAKKALIKGASFGLKYPCAYYDTLLIDAVGQCYFLLLTQFPLIYGNSKVISATALAYIYLSRCIEIGKKQTYDSYRSRAFLFYDHKSPMVLQSIIMDNLGMGVLIDPLMISDFYLTSQVLGNPHEEVLSFAKRIHQRLEDISVGGKDADEYSLTEISEIGEKRHYVLFKQLEEKYKIGKFNLTLKELSEINT